MSAGGRPSLLVRLRAGLTVLAVLVASWELLSILVTAKGSYGEPLVPGWSYLVRNSLLRMSDYWDGSFGVPSPANGGPPTYAAAFLALAEASAITFARLILGVGAGLIVGVALGLVVATSDLARRLIAPTVHILRMTPFLAMIPLFNLWFGASTVGIVLFVAYGVTVIMFIGATNAATNVPNVYFERAATVGASRAAVFRYILLPAIFPEIRSSVLLSLGLAWSLIVAGELLGAQSGLGVIVTYALQFAYTGRVLVVTFLIIFYAGVSFSLFEVISRRIIDWHPQVERRLR
ncbi:MAG TPA: ABC transporter permease subunit [Roseiarcus sp.]|jgi:sulfonate transport system permease protein|nr:ABC transporter permease subunit [Roseiarcus sp.]